MKSFSTYHVFISLIVYFVCINKVFVNANVHNSPKGVSTSSFILQFHDGKQITETNCSSYRPQIKSLPSDLAWPLTHFSSLTDSVTNELKELKKLTPQQQEFQTVYTLDNKDHFAFLGKCLGHSLVLNQKKGMSEAFCECLSPLEANQYCTVLNSLYTAPVCLDSVAKFMNHTEYCDVLKTKYLFDDVNKMDLSPKCSTLVNDTVKSNDLFLFPLLDTAKQIPDNIDSSIIRQEVSTYFWVYKALERFIAWTDLHLFCRKEKLTFSLNDAKKLDPGVVDLSYVLPGWKSIMYFYKYNLTFDKHPIAILSEREPSEKFPLAAFGKKNYLIIIRNFRTTEEAVIGLSHRMEEMVHDNVDGLAHVGYSVLANALFTEMEIFLSKILNTVQADSTLKFTIVGEGNLGGGAAAILGLLLAKNFPIIPLNHQKINYDVISFDAGPVGDGLFTSELVSNVNLRNIKSKYFGLYTEPCHMMQYCDEEFASVEIPRMKSLPGLVEFEIENDCNIPAAWFHATTKAMCKAHSFYFATSCWLGAQQCGVSPTEMCQI